MIPHEFFHLLLWLLVAHALCDFPLQGDFLAKAKNHRAPIANVEWFPCLTAHALIQAAGVGVVTNSVTLAAAEFTFHMLIDWCKSEGLIGFGGDQVMHVACRIIWAGIAIAC